MTTENKRISQEKTSRSSMPYKEIAGKPDTPTTKNDEAQPQAGAGNADNKKRNKKQKKKDL
jgi:hypothetical protein